MIEISWFFILSLLLIFSFLRFFLISWWDKREETIFPDYNPNVILIIPCKGVDIQMERNLRSFLNEDYDRLKIVAVIDSLDDPSVEIIKKVGMDFIISDSTYKGSGKVKAISTAINQFRERDVYVMADSDTEVPKDWIKFLVNPLLDPSIGVVTTYPIYEPFNNFNFWSMIKKVWGFLGINMMEFRPSRFAWGGSMAIRKDLLSDEDFEYFSSSVSDDAAITRICSKKNLAIYYSKKSTPKVHVDETRSTFVEWATRQMAISISHSRMAFSAGLILYLSIIVYMFALIPLSILITNYFLLGYIPFLLTMIINARRTDKNKISIFFLSFIMPPIFLYNLINGKMKTHIEWRGTKYKLQK